MGADKAGQYSGVCGVKRVRGQQAVNASSSSSTFLVLFLEHFQLPSGWSDNLRNEMCFVFLHMRLDLGYVEQEGEGNIMKKCRKLLWNFVSWKLARNQSGVKKIT